MSREGVFWGWGEPGAGPSLPDHAAGFLRSALGRRGRGRVAAGRARGGAAAPAGAGRRGARAARGDRGGGARARRRAPRACGRCRGKSYLDLLRQRAGDCEDAPDAVVAPGDAREAQQVIYACSEEGVAVVPYGGGTSVVGGLEPLRGALRRADLARPRPAGGAAVLRRALADRVAGGRDAAAGGRPRPGARRLHARPHAAELRVGDGRGLRRHALGGPVLDRARADRGATSWRCAARRRLGELATLAVPATAAGPSLSSS